MMMEFKCYNCGYVAQGQKFLVAQGPSEWKFVMLLCPQCSSNPPKLGVVGVPAPFKLENEVTVDRAQHRIRVNYAGGGAFEAPLLPDYP